MLDKLEILARVSKISAEIWGIYRDKSKDKQKQEEEITALRKQVDDLKKQLEEKDKAKDKDKKKIS